MGRSWDALAAFGLVHACVENLGINNNDDDNNNNTIIIGGSLEVDVVPTTDWEDLRAGMADEDHDDVDDWGGGGDHHAAPAALSDDARG